MAVLDVPGARLHHTVTGSGPTLLCIPGGAADSAMFTPIAGLLAEHYTVITYDPRGISHSTLDDPDEQQRIEVHADDVLRLLDSVSEQPAMIFASSGGCMQAFELVTHHPGRVRTLVAHEPPLTSLLAEQPDIDPDELLHIHREHGIEAAMGKFMADAGFEAGGEALPPEMRKNMEFFVVHLMKMIGDFTPDYAALKASGTRIVVGVGKESAGQPAHEAAVLAAGRLGVEPAYFPGDHGGFAAEAAAFAPLLREILGV
ncbi:alpha/beta hydrolase [Amycolatopsis sp. WAC 01416]|uniref:alpha/beta fold hydrolase n=1 Tax=Amycolatopsis sp. WAC 01416 TaxID=2203196 RepID=UPI000F76FAA2|nr:alpha/beta hydrolase [Amycolatopsis sp. WAC 01416]RSN24849.1 alpha/beta hydrolase [Amycolatopsis sp. WAC 01416]